MRTDCLDIGTIQAFLDGELPVAETASVSTHISVCDACAAMLALAEDESAIVFPALDREFDTLVPTQRLWNRINESIAVEKQHASVWEKARAFLVSAFANPSIAVAAGLLIVAGGFAMLIINRAPVQTDLAVVESPPVSITPVLTGAADPSRNDQLASAPRPSLPTIERAAYRPDSGGLRRLNAEPAVYRRPSVAVSTASYMPGEESYVKTIDSLTRSVDDQKNAGAMRPSQRVAYERDLAVVNDSITRMRAELKRNPKNESAKQVLYSSYQNKIDLLNSVAQKEELVASLR